MTKKQQLRNRADRLWFLKYLQERCEVCGETATQVHHFFPKGLYPSVRYSELNAISLCKRCHFFHHQRGDPTIHKTIIEKRGQKWYNQLKEESSKKITQTISYYEDIIAGL